MSDTDLICFDPWKGHWKVNFLDLYVHIFANKHFWTESDKNFHMSVCVCLCVWHDQYQVQTSIDTWE